MASPRRDQALSALHDRFHSEPLVLDKWMGLEGGVATAGHHRRCAFADGASGIHVEEPQPGAGAGRSFCHGQSAPSTCIRLLRNTVQALVSIDPRTAARTAAAIDAERQHLIKREVEAVDEQIRTFEQPSPGANT